MGPEAAAVAELRASLAKAELAAAELASERRGQVARDAARQGARQAARALRKEGSGGSHRAWTRLPNGVMVRRGAAAAAETCARAEEAAGQAHRAGEERIKALLVRLEDECGGAAPGAAGKGLVKALAGLRG